MKIGLIILSSLTLLACKNTTENEVNTEKIAESTIENPTENSTEKIVESLPKVELKVETLSREENRDERFGTESSSEVVLYIDGKKIDSYFEYGDGQMVDSTLFLSSEMSEKSYTFHTEKETVKVVFVKYGSTEFMDFDENGEPIPMSEWETIYTKNKSGEWKKIKCKGDCD